MSRTEPVVAIDGPAGAGKSTITKRVARKLGYLVLDTGALYRTVALAARRASVDWSDANAVALVAYGLAKRDAIAFRNEGGESQSVWLDGEDISLAIRTQEMSEGASRVSSIPLVRDALLDLQRRVGQDGGVVVEGRDIGSVVFPDAEAKFYLTASDEVRAKRRLDELVARGEQTDSQTVLREVRERDARDRNRRNRAPDQAKDAELVDSSFMGIDEVVDVMVNRVREIAAT
ncbi:MAG: (d)CMP kinase [Polyangiaceae bacterium]